MIDVDDETASVIAGWSPDETYWLTDTVDLGGDSHTWVLDTTAEPNWVGELPE